MHDSIAVATGAEVASGAIEISLRGRRVEVPALQINGRTVIVDGRWLKVASVHDEEWLEGEVVAAPDGFIARLREHKELEADLFTFTQKPTDPAPRHAYPYELDSVAAIPVISYTDWWRNRVSTDLRNDVRKAAKRGLEVRVVPFTDDFVRAIMGIYDETPIRQGRLFWHYKMGFEEAKRANATYLERSEFVGAYVGDELVGFLKIVYVDRFARLMQIISKDAHRNRRPMNALLAKAVELIAARGCPLLTYGKYRYSQGADSVTAFKSRNGFEEILVPKYYVPVTAKGKLAMGLHLHHGVRAWLPNSVRLTLKRARLSLHQRTWLTRKAR
ncbi:MAG: GNAT family N-acetyltransferase [Terriglobales bacterium]|jgi:hypothetical protein